VHKKFTWSELPLEEVNPLFSRRMIVGERIMVAHILLKKGCVIPKHRHVNEQVSYVLSGALRFWVGKGASSEDETDSVLVGAGEVITIPSDVPHKAVAIEETLSVDIFTPPREDWLAGTDNYLRK
jgi:quercetin dioxygenase-like cupin family protein